VPDPEHRFAWLPPRVEYIDGVEWKLMNIVQYRTAAGEVSTVKRGFIFDFASVPRPLAWLYPAAGDGSNHYGIAALFHDWLYAHRKIKDRPITRREADAIFYEIMRYVGCRRTLAWTMWLAVRTGGWLPWARRKPHEVIP
jgi:hypothetical protein